MASKDRIYGFDKQRAAVLKQVADSRMLSPSHGGGGATMSPLSHSGIWIVETTASLTARSSTTFGSGAVKLKKKNSSNALVDRVASDGTSTVTKTLYNYWSYAVPSGHILLANLTLDGTLLATEWLTRPHLICRFTAGSSFTTSSSSVSGTITNYYGFGDSHASSSATFNNLLTATASAYLFEGASGAAGLAYYTGSGTTWQIIQMECP